MSGTKTKKAPAKPETIGQTPRPRATIKLDAPSAKLLVRGYELVTTFKPWHFNLHETKRKVEAVVDRLRAVPSDGAVEQDCEDYHFAHHVINGLRALMVSGALTDADAALAAKIHADYMTTRPWDKHDLEHDKKDAVSWRLRVWLVDRGYGPHATKTDSHHQGLPPGVIAMVDRWRSDVDGRHVMAIYDDRVREATLHVPYNHGSWCLRSEKRYQTTDELDAILRPFVTKPGTTWDAPASVVQGGVVEDGGLALRLGAQTVAALRRAVAVRLDASDEDVKLVRAFMAKLNKGA
jgi:hypothetical protein